MALDAQGVCLVGRFSQAERSTVELRIRDSNSGSLEFSVLPYRHYAPGAVGVASIASRAPSSIVSSRFALDQKKENWATPPGSHEPEKGNPILLLPTVGQTNRSPSLVPPSERDDTQRAGVCLVDLFSIRQTEAPYHLLARERKPPSWATLECPI